MLRLFLLRHAKSSWDSGAATDFDRPLNGRGRGAAPLIGTFMAEQGLVPQRILCSAAQRTRETLALVLPHFAADMTVSVTRRLYGADASGYLDAIRAFGEAAPAVMVIGHNPATEDLAMILSGTGNEAAMDAIRVKYPTAALAVIEFDTARWADIGPGAGRLAAFVPPRALKFG